MNQASDVFVLKASQEMPVSSLCHHRADRPSDSLIKRSPPSITRSSEASQPWGGNKGESCQVSYLSCRAVTALRCSLVLLNSMQGHGNRDGQRARDKQTDRQADRKDKETLRQDRRGGVEALRWTTVVVGGGAARSGG